MKAGQAFEHIQGSVNEVAEQVLEVSSAIEQMSAIADICSIEYVVRLAEDTAGGAQRISAASQEQLGSMEEVSESADTLSRVADELETLTGKFKV
ncbi:hypothetical protein ACP26L_22630 [Paenibacillus sp. S-38]|uniref:hypothetical protein n=1 Tax=Paenibacillus sp. S-38 TaxID=3416710 RepID=UPI003CF87919